MLCVTAYVLRFVNKIKWCQLRHTGNYEENDELKASNLEQAESLWIRTVQANAFSNETSYLQKGCQGKPDRVALYLDDNQALRCPGRINNSSLQPESKHLILLTWSHPFVELLICQTHEKVKDSAVNNMLATIQERFWILHGRQAVKVFHDLQETWRTVISSELFSRSTKHPSRWLPAIYTCRSRFWKPCIHSKCYICLFTCVATCAVHLEFTRNLTVKKIF